MNQRNIWYRWLFYGLGAVLFLLLQSVVLWRIRVWGIHPFIPPVLVAVAASWESRQEGICAAAVFGLLCDLTMSPPIPCFYLLTFTASAFFAGLVAKRWILPGFFCAVAVSLGAMIINGAFQALLLSFRGINDPGAAASITGREMLLTAPLIPLVYLLFRRIHRRFTTD